MAKRNGSSNTAGTSASGDKPNVDSQGRGGGQNPRKGSQGYSQGRAPDNSARGRG